MKDRNTHSPLPGISIRELIRERNWPALGGLALIVLGLLYIVEDITGLDLNLWSLVMLGLGGWLIYDGYQRYQANNRTWTDTGRSRAAAGGVIALIGLLSAVHISGFTLLLLIVAGLLGYDAWNTYQQNNRVWTERARSRMTGAAVLAGIALLSLINLWSTWPVILIGIGVVMLFGFVGGKNR